MKKAFVGIIRLFVVFTLGAACIVSVVPSLGRDSVESLPTRVVEAELPPLPPTFTPAHRNAGASVTRHLKAEMDELLGDYDYQQQRVRVVDVQVENRVLLIHIKREGQPSGADFFGQLGLIHAAVARNNPDVRAFATVDVDAGNGFLITMSDLISYWNGKIGFDEFRDRWSFFEP